eukprot:6212059-Pleurochrysis_carterae.AAC.2
MSSKCRECRLMQSTTFARRRGGYVKSEAQAAEVGLQQAEYHDQLLGEQAHYDLRYGPLGQLWD